MLNMLKQRYFNELYATGFVESGLSLPDDIIDGIKAHYAPKALGDNDFPKFFAKNEHQAYMESQVIGFLLSNFPGVARNWLKKLYDKQYDKAIYGEQSCLEGVLRHLMDSGFAEFFQARYVIASYDVYLRSTHNSRATGIHTDLPNFHHFYETENDLSVFVPLVDLDEENGGRITVLPEAKLKVPSNVLLKLLYDHFSKDPQYVDEDGYVDPDKVDKRALTAFAKTKVHQDLLAAHKGVISMARRQYAKDFSKPKENRGKVLVFNHKNFHAAEKWKNEKMAREVYIVRFLPIYDTKIKLKSDLHGRPVNNFLLDMKERTVTHRPGPVNMARIAEEEKMRI
jgi:hypothetical protein